MMTEREKDWQGKLCHHGKTGNKKMSLSQESMFCYVIIMTNNLSCENRPNKGVSLWPLRASGQSDNKVLCQGINVNC